MKSAAVTRKEQDVVCNQKADVVDEISAAIVIPVAMVTAYIWFLRQWYFTFLADGKGESSIFKEVWWECPAVATVLYLCTIFGLKRYMKDRPVPALKNYMLTYNMYQTILNAWCVLSFIKEAYKADFSVWGNRYQPQKDFQISFLVWVHYNNKYMELLDTVFMALRKKNNQISFLHVYHHVLLIWSWFAVCKIEPGGDSYFGATVNSFIHVLMYSYYACALLKIQIPWKRQLTNCQMVQFCACFSQSIYVLNAGTYNKFLTWLQIWVMSNMLVLFGNFYRKQYLNKAAQKKKE